MSAVAKNTIYGDIDSDFEFNWVKERRQAQDVHLLILKNKHKNTVEDIAFICDNSNGEGYEAAFYVKHLNIKKGTSKLIEGMRYGESLGRLKELIMDIVKNTEGGNYCDRNYYREVYN